MIDRATLDPAQLAPDSTNPTVAGLMRDEVVFCLPSTPIDAVAKLLADNDLAEIPVLIDRRPVGYVRSSDIVAKLAEGRVATAGSDLVRPSVTDVLAQDVLHSPPLLVDEAAQMEEVVALMRGQHRQTALVMHEDESPVGLLTTSEVAAYLAARLQAGQVAGGGADG